MKRWAIWLLLIATLVATYFAPQPEAEAPVVAANVARVQATSHPSSEMVRKDRAVDNEAFNLQIRARKTEEDLGNMFVSHTWTAPPPKVMATTTVEPPSPPEAPPLPFRFLGRLIEDGKVVYFLQFNDRNLVLHLGDSVDKTYTLESANGGILTFAYLPLNKKQTLAVGEVN